MLGDLGRALGQLGDRRFLRVFGLSLLLTGALLAAFLAGWGWVVSLIPAEFSLFGIQLGALGGAAGVVAWIAGGLAAVFLMFPVAAVFIGLFLEDIADAVEAKHYPALPPAGRMGFWEMLGDGLLFAATLIGANLLALAVYLVSGPLGPFVFLAVNGWLLSRQYFELAAARRRGAARARALRKAQGAGLLPLGVVMALGLSVPVLALAVPVLAVAAFTHAAHRAAGGYAEGRDPRPRPPV